MAPRLILDQNRVHWWITGRERGSEYSKECCRLKSLAVSAGSYSHEEADWAEGIMSASLLAWSKTEPADGYLISRRHQWSDWACSLTSYLNCRTSPRTVGPPPLEPRPWSSFSG